MNTNKPAHAAALAAGAAFTAASTRAADKPSVAELIAKIKDADDSVRGPAWQGAGPTGAPAVKPLAEVMAAAELEVARAAKRALWKIVRHAGRPGADRERKTVATAIVPLLAKGDPNSRREFVWMLSEIGADESVKPLAALLAHPDLREDARAALQRIPGAESLAALKAALASAPPDYRPAIAVSLRVRGETISGYPSEKLVPTRTTRVKSAAA